MILTKKELKEVVEQLKSIRGSHTELISVLVPADTDINTVQKQLEAEKSTAKNIKSTSTRKNVIEALEKIVRELKEMKKTPENGLALYCGNVSKDEGNTDIELWAIQPPKPLKMRTYRCDKEFVLEPLEEMLEVEELYGLLVMDRKEATIGILRGKLVEVLQKLTSGIPSKVRAGGQCLHKSSLVNTKKGLKKIDEIKIGDKINAFDFDKKKVILTEVINKWKVKKKIYKIIITKDNNLICSNDHTLFIKKPEEVKEIPANSISLKDTLIDNKFRGVKIHTIIENKQDTEMIDIETKNHNFLANGLIVHNSSQRFHRITEGLTKDFYKRIAEEMKKSFFEMPKLKGILVGGPIPTKDEFLDNEYLTTQLQEKVIGRVDIGDTDESGLGELVGKSQEILEQQEIMKEKKLLQKFFEILGQNPELAVYKPENLKKALQYGAIDTILLSDDLDKKIAEDIKKQAENISSNIEYVSNETEEGKQFKNLTQGVGAILRFKIG